MWHSIQSDVMNTSVTLLERKEKKVALLSLYLIEYLCDVPYAFIHIGSWNLLEEHYLLFIC